MSPFARAGHSQGVEPYLQLALAEGFGEGMVLALLGPDVDPHAVLRAPPEPPAIPPRVAERLRDPTLAERARALAATATAAGLTVLTPADPRWPEPLLHLAQRPLVLFVRGDPAALQRAPAAAMVGSRTPTPYGADAARQFAAALAQAGVSLWSGLARGIDGIAHEACVTAGVPTVAVLAGGLDRIYPPEHAALAARIEATGGCLISELPPGHVARRGHFPRRNRLIAAGTSRVVVVEASLTSGALHTARFAAECGVDVYALPGPWQSERSQGCHRLVGEGARLLEDPESLLRDLGVAGPAAAGTALHFAHSADEHALVQRLQQGPRPGDLLQRESGLDRATFLRALFGLQARGAVARFAGDLWALTGSGPPDSLTNR
ncbi:MAG: DNA-protecting protein DprA [Planctomycetes bacterium]|nr:DNA-protecting protein DprA [Planctomycetota bacterium]